MGIIIAIIVFGLIVTVHEFGHFICAKLSGIKVLEFSVGMGPKLLQKQKGETKYSLRLLPVGGYCAMEGEDSTNSDPRSFRNARLWKRMLVLVAGPLMNFVLGFIACIILACMYEGIPTAQVGFFAKAKTEEGTIISVSHSEQTGLQEGDEIKKIGDISIFSFMDIPYALELGDDDYFDVVVKRGGERMTLKDVCFLNDAKLNSAENAERRSDFYVARVPNTPATVMGLSSRLTFSMGHVVTLSLKQLLTGKAETEDVSGPVGVVTTINESTKEAETPTDLFFQVIYMMALISINVGIFNLLPIPGLDGGRLLFCLIELVRRKPVKPEHEGYVHLAGMVLLFGIMIFATYNDIVRLLTGGK